MSLVEIKTQESDANLQLTYRLEQEEAYKAECLRIFNSIKRKNEEAGGRIAFEKTENGKLTYLVLLGVCTRQEKDLVHQRWTKKHRVFVLAQDKIMFKDYPGDIFTEDFRTINDINKNIRETIFINSDLLGRLQLYSGDSDGKVDDLQTAINNSLIHAVQRPPIDPEKLASIT